MVSSVSLPSNLQHDTVMLSISAGVAISIAVWGLLSKWRSNHLPYPPGPAPDPIIGNARHMIGDEIHIKFCKWQKQYGDICFVKVFGQPLVSINTLEVAKDLIEKQGAVFAGRPYMVMMGELMGLNDYLVFHQPGSRFRRHRRLVKEHFSASSLVKYRNLQKSKVISTLSHIAEAPGQCREHLKHFSASMILNIGYGYKAGGFDDKMVAIAEDALQDTVSMPFGAVPVDFFPILKHWPTWLPFSGWKRFGYRTNEKVQLMNDYPFGYVKDHLAEGTLPQCLARDLFEILASQHETSKDPIDELDIKLVTGMLYGAGADTTSTALSTFLLAMTLHPEIYARIQAEIDEKVGSRLPEFEDKGHLPYFEATLKEVLRWGCPLPLGFPHRATEDCIYRDMFIPKDSTMMINTWAITRDESVYPDPEKFEPERFLGKLGSDAAKQVDIVFGLGRRICPGKAFSEANLWLFASNFSAIFDVCKASDENGNLITPSTEYTSGGIRHPKPFPTKVTLRSERAREMLAQASADSSLL